MHTEWDKHISMLTKRVSEEVKNIDEVEGLVEAYANVYDVEDSDGDISEKGAFDATVSRDYKRIRVLKDHDKTLVLGVPVEIDTKDSHGLRTVTKFNMTKQLSKDMLSDIMLAKQYGLNAELSIGFAKVKRDSADRRRIKEYGWLGEYSFLSSWAANEHSVVTNVKQLADSADIDVIELLTKMYDLPHSDERLREVERILKSFSDEEDEEDEGDYLSGFIF